MPRSTHLPIENPNLAKSDVLQRIVGLAFCCPYSQDNPSSCPIHKVRLLPHPRALAGLKAWDSEKMHNFEHYHIQCLRSLEGAPEESE